MFDGRKKSLLFAFKENELSARILAMKENFNREHNHLPKTEVAHDDNARRMDVLSGANRILIASNLDFSSFFGHNRYPVASWVAPDAEDSFLQHFEKTNLIGFQRHLIPQNILQGLDLNDKENLSLGLLRQDIQQVEPVFRHSDIIHFNLAAVRKSENPELRNNYVAGFTAGEFIQLVKLAGYSDRVKILNFQTDLISAEQCSVTAEIIATALWYFEESVSQNMTADEDEGDTHMVHFEEGDFFIQFTRSTVTQKCFFRMEDHEKSFPCSLDEFEHAVLRGQVSERIIKALAVL